MTKSETLSYIKAYLDGDTAVGNIIPLRNVLESAIKYLSEPSLPSNLDEAAEEYSENILANNEDLQDAIEDAFKAGAEWMAEQSFPRWRNIDEEKPKQGEDCACISVTVNGHIKYSNFEEGPWSWDDKVDSDWLGTTEAFVGYNFYGDKEYHTCSYWMPWDEFWGSLERQFKNSGME